MLEQNFEKARKVAYRYLSFRPRTECEITERLLQKGFDDQTIIQVIKNLREYHLLDDELYAENYVANRPLRSRVMLAGELKSRGISESVADSALENIDSGAELRIAIALAVGRRKRRGDHYPLRNIASFLRRRGFSQEVVERACDFLENMQHT